MKSNHNSKKQYALKTYLKREPESNLKIKYNTE